MKTAFVLVAHVGDRGRKDEGDVIPDLTNQRFEDLEKVGLVREATADEIKAWKPRFEAEADEHPARTIVVDVAELNALRSKGTDDADTIFVLRGELSDARTSLEEANRKIERLTTDFGNAGDLIKQHEETIVTLTNERDQARTARPAETPTPPVSGEKEAAAPDNKQAPAPDNKQAPAPKTKA